LFGHFQQSSVQGLGPFLLGKAELFFPKNLRLDGF